MGQLTLKTIPGSKKPDIIFNNLQGLEDSHRPGKANEAVLTVRLREPAQKNKANKALCKLLSKLSGTPVHIVSGTGSKLKVVAFDMDNRSFIQKIRESLGKQKLR
ncbi:MAG: DUF167 domain-containing protein [Candidatus Micrarchaeota archaeon]